jgi:hypothetical protein
MQNNTDFFNHNNWVFVSYEYGGGGHRLARKICCLPNYYWYSCLENGKHPWNVSSWRSLPVGNFLKKIRNIASAHYAQRTPYGILPFDYSIGKEWIPDKEQYYANFSNQFVKAHGPILLNNYKLVYISHSLPEEILETFPNAKIINLIDDPKKITDRYMYTTADFPADFSIAFQWIPDIEYTLGYSKHRIIKKTFQEQYTMKDMWSYDKFATMWKEDYKDEYYQNILEKITNNINHRLTAKHQNILTVNKKETTAIKQFLLR